MSPEQKVPLTVKVAPGLPSPSMSSLPQATSQDAIFAEPSSATSIATVAAGMCATPTGERATVTPLTGWGSTRQKCWRISMWLPLRCTLASR